MWHESLVPVSNLDLEILGMTTHKTEMGAKVEWRDVGHGSERDCSSSQMGSVLVYRVYRQKYKNIPQENKRKGDQDREEM